jgi:CheY-like chemotaxis protein
MRMLVVHEFGVMRRIVSRYALAEFDNLEVESAASAQEALESLRHDKFDVVISAMEMEGLNGLGLYHEMRSGSLNKETPFIIMTSTDTPEQRQRIVSSGVANYLIMPFTPLELREMVARLSNPREMRATPRFSIPATTAVITLESGQIEAEVVNISLGGVLGELTFSEEILSLFEPVMIDILFPADYGEAKAGGIKAGLVRVNVISWREDRSAEKLRMAWNFVDIPKAARNTLSMALDRAQQELSLERTDLEG